MTRLYVFSLFIRNELTNPDINEIWGLWTVIPARLWIHNILQRIHTEVKVTHKAGHVLCWPWPRLQTSCPGFTTDWPPCHSAWHGCCPQASSARCTWPPLLLALLLLCVPQGRMVERQGPTSPASQPTEHHNLKFSHLPTVSPTTLCFIYPVSISCILGPRCVKFYLYSYTQCLLEFTSEICTSHLPYLFV